MHIKKGSIDLSKWENVTELFSEESRHYRDTYMEINEVYDNAVEVSLFSSDEGPYEIYFSYDKFYGIIYVDGERAYSKREEIKKELVEEYELNKKATSKFINAFAEKHQVCMPNDIFFDASPLFGL